MFTISHYLTPMTYPNVYSYSNGFAYSKESGYDLFVLHTYDLPLNYISKINPKRPQFIHMAKITKREIREGLEQIPIEQLLLGSAGSKQLTHKQKTFAKEVALGKPKAQAYRIAYDTKGTPVTASANAQKLVGNTRIKLLIEAYSRAFEAREYQKPERLRELVIHQLTELALNPEVKDAQRIRSLELLGKASDVFVERKETKVIHESSKIKERLLDQLKNIINVDASEIDEGDSLLRELAGNSPTESEPQDDDPTTPRPPKNDHAEHGNYIHINPNTQSASIDEQTENHPSQPHDLEQEKSEVETFPPTKSQDEGANLPTDKVNTPLNDGEKKGVGGTNLGKEGKGEDIGTPPVNIWKEKG